MATTVQQLEREAAKREALEIEVKQLGEQMEDDKRRLQSRHTAELERRRTEWEDERNTLLTIIQNECNSAFDRRREKWATKSSPTSVDTQFFPAQLNVDTELDEQQSAGRIHGAKTVASVISPAYSDFDSVLRETEEFIQSLM